jgi:hypothetical protein
MGQISVRGRVFNIQGDAPTAEEAQQIKNAFESGKIAPSVPDDVSVPDVPRVPSFVEQTSRTLAEMRATPASEQPPPPEPNLWQRGVRRLLQTDVQDPVPGTRMASTLTGTLGGMYGSGKLGDVLAGAARAAPHPFPRAVAPFIKPAMKMVGSAVGAGGGAMAPEAIVAGFESAGIIPKGYRKQKLLGNDELREIMLGEVLLSGYFDVGIGAAKHSYRTASRILQGPTRSGTELAMAAKQLGIQLPGTTTGKSWLNRLWTPIFGRFPLIGAPIKHQSDLAADQVIDVLQMKVMGPLISETKLGEQLYRKGKAAVRAMDRYFGKRYKIIWDQADKLGIMLDPQILREEGQNILDELSKKTAEGVDLPVGWQPVADFIETQVLKLGGENGGPITYHQLDGFMHSITQKMSAIDNPETQRYANKLLSRLRTAGTANASDVSSVVKMSGDAAPEAAEVFFKDMRALDQEFAGAMQTLASSAGKKFGTVERGGLRSIGYTEATRTPADQLFKVFENIQSPQMMKELAAIVNVRTMRDLAAHRMQKMVESATDVRVERGVERRFFDGDVLREKLGFNNPRSARYETTKYLLDNHSLLDMKELKTFVDAGGTLKSVEVPNMATMPARAGTIGGLKGALKAIAPGSAALGATGFLSSLWGMALSIIPGRAISSLLANPKATLPIKTIISESADHSQRVKAYIQAARAVVEIGVNSGQLERRVAVDLINEISNMVEKGRPVSPSPSDPSVDVFDPLFNQMRPQFQNPNRVIPTPQSQDDAALADLIARDRMFTSQGWRGSPQYREQR